MIVDPWQLSSLLPPGGSGRGSKEPAAAAAAERRRRQRQNAATASTREAERPSLDITDCCKNSSVEESSDLVRRGSRPLHRVGTRRGVRGHRVGAVGHRVGRSAAHQGAVVAGGVVGLHRLDLALCVWITSCRPSLSTGGQIHRDHLIQVALLAARCGGPGHRLPLHLGRKGT